MDSQLHEMSAEQIAFMLASVDLNLEEPIRSWHAFTENVPDTMAQGTYFKLAHAVKRKLAPSAQERAGSIRARIELLHRSLPLLQNAPDERVRAGWIELALELVALLERERLCDVAAPGPVADPAPTG